MTDTSDCETCSGTGTVTVDRADPRGEHFTADVDCPDCTGDDAPDDAADWTSELESYDEAECRWESAV